MQITGNQQVSHKGKTFVNYISAKNIHTRVQSLGLEIAAKYAGKNPLFIGVLNGAFVFSADLARALPFPCEWTFVKLSSYKGRKRAGKNTRPPHHNRRRYRRYGQYALSVHRRSHHGRTRKCCRRYCLL
jgi:hypoxanthine-guanine phosphoribosyltransferase